MSYLGDGKGNALPATIGLFKNFETDGIASICESAAIVRTKLGVPQASGTRPAG